jgi:negative regulator of flagellin synthesis FlgM
MDITKVRSDKISEAQVKDGANVGKSQKAKDSTVSGATVERPAQPGSESVKWSPEASMIQEGVEAAKQADTHRADKVKSLREAIRNGTYKPDAAKVADAMIQSSIEEGVLSRKL